MRKSTRDNIHLNINTKLKLKCKTTQHYTVEIKYSWRLIVKPIMYVLGRPIQKPVVPVLLPNLVTVGDGYVRKDILCKTCAKQFAQHELNKPRQTSSGCFSSLTTPSTSWVSLKVWGTEWWKMGSKWSGGKVVRVEPASTFGIETLWPLYFHHSDSLIFGFCWNEEKMLVTLMCGRLCFNLSL